MFNWEDEPIVKDIYYVIADYIYYDEEEPETEEVINYFWFESIEDARKYINSTSVLPYGEWNEDETIKSFTEKYFGSHYEIPEDADLGLGEYTITGNVRKISLKIIKLIKNTFEGGN